MCSRTNRWLSAPLFALMLLSALVILLLQPLLVPSAHADGGAPNLAYVAGTSQGISVIDIAQQKVTSTIAARGNPDTILLSIDGRFLYVTEPQTDKVSVIAAKTGQEICSADVPGQPTLLTIDPGTSTLYTAGNGAARVTALDPVNCSIKHTFTTHGPVYGLSVAVVGSGISGTTGNQLWVSDDSGLSIFDDLKGQLLGTIPIPGGARYISIPPGATVYVTTREGSVEAVDLNSHHVDSLLSGGRYGPMDYDAITGEVYVPDSKNNQLVVLTPINAGFPMPKEPNRVFRLSSPPASVAITNDGQFGFVALSGGNVAMLDLPARQVASTIHVGGSPRFIITGLYPPVVGTTPQQASVFVTIINIAAYALVIALFIVPILLFRRYTKKSRQALKKSE